MTTVNQMKCACPDCLCIVNLNDAVMKDGKAYCGEACANGHPEGAGCGHTGCGCHS
jgi:hypothetical protein